jgi:hypothetical protein
MVMQNEMSLALNFIADILECGSLLFDARIMSPSVFV